jgi:uncharacterized membrane protein
MNNDRSIGVFVMLTILLLLVGFLMAIKVRTYSMAWSVTCIFVGVFQATRFFFTKSNLEGSTAILMQIILIVSALFCIGGGVLSVIKTTTRKNLK